MPSSTSNERRPQWHCSSKLWTTLELSHHPSVFKFLSTVYFETGHAIPKRHLIYNMHRQRRQVFSLMHFKKSSSSSLPKKEMNSPHANTQTQHQREEGGEEEEKKSTFQKRTEEGKTSVRYYYGLGSNLESDMVPRGTIRLEEEPPLPPLPTLLHQSPM